MNTQQTRIQIITPEMAAMMLETNTNNRPTRLKHVWNLASDMRSGAWQLTHQGIAFDSTGRLIDGQHRLRAVIEAGVSVQMSVTRGCSPQSFAILDQGANRSTSDILGWPKKLTETMVLALTITYGTHSTVSRVKRMLDSELMDACKTLLELCPSVRAGKSSAPVKLAACTQMVVQRDYEFVIAQYRALLSENYPEMTPCSQSFNKQCRDKRYPREELFVRAMITFDKNEANRTFIRITDEIISEKNEIVRRVVKKHIGNDQA